MAQLGLIQPSLPDTAGLGCDLAHGAGTQGHQGRPLSRALLTSSLSCRISTSPGLEGRFMAGPAPLHLTRGQPRLQTLN